MVRLLKILNLGLFTQDRSMDMSSFKRAQSRGFDGAGSSSHCERWLILCSEARRSVIRREKKSGYKAEQVKYRGTTRPLQ